jgi:hypothetical protein
VIAQLDQEVSSGDSSARRELARVTRDYLSDRGKGKASALGVDQAMERCAATDDMELRKFVAVTLRFWEGTPEENERMEKTLLALSDAANVPANADTVRAREVRYQATQALARRGSKKALERMPVLAEMLDEDSLSKIFRSQRKNYDGPDTAIIGLIMTDALNSIAALHHKAAERGDNIDLAPLLPAIQNLTQHANAAIRAEAERTMIELTGKKS